MPLAHARRPKYSPAPAMACSQPAFGRTIRCARRPTETFISARRLRTARITSITPSISRASCRKFIASSTFGQSESMIVPSVPGMWRYTSSVMNGMNG